MNPPSGDAKKVNQLTLLPSLRGACENFRVIRSLAQVLALFWLWQATGVSAPTKPNVLFIAVDDLKPILGCFGDPVAKTPNLDRLAARGMVFEKAYVNQAVCAPSRNSLMLGIRPQNLGLYDLRTYFRDIPAYSNVVTMGQTFRKAGYEVEGLGKIYHPNMNDEPTWSVPHQEFKGEVYANPENRSPEGKGKGAPTEAGEVEDDFYADGKIAEEAVARLKKFQKNPDQPFFLMVGFHKPHLPFVAPKKYWDLYRPADFQLAGFRTAPEGAPSYAPTTSGEILKYRNLPVEELPFPDDFARHLIHGYYAATSFSDAQIGKVLTALEESGLAKNTVIVVWGDHGWHLGDHGMWCKHTNYEQATHAAILMSGPGIPEGQRTQSLIETVDLYPTLVELAGLPKPETGIAGLELDGKSLLPLFQDPKNKVKDYVFHAYPRSEKPEQGAKRRLIGRAVRDERYRLVEWKQPGEPADKATLELYDYETDPLEKKNLALEKPEIVAKLRAVLAKIPEAKPQQGEEGSPESGYEKKEKKEKKKMKSKDDGE
ncbi:DUF4976 domain-containing protein [bacterium]|nr:DUF4976 domain-containing protein [bacterium]